MKDFKKLNIWNLGMDLAVDTYQFSEELPKEEKYGIRSQITRASISIPANIAEGCSRSSQKDFKRFLEIALGSAFELETFMILIQRIGMFKNEKEILSLIDKTKETQIKTGALISKINKDLRGL